MSPCFLVIQICLSDRMVCRSIAAPAYHSVAQTQIIRYWTLDLRMSSISQHISPRSDSQWGNEHHIWCNRHGFHPETTYPAFRRAVPYTEVSLFLTGVLANREMLFYIPIRFKVYRSLNKEVVAPLSDSFPFTVRWVYTSASCSILFSRCRRGCISPLIPYLGKFRRLTTKNQKKVFNFSKMALLRLLTACCDIPRCLAMVFSLSGVLDRYRQ